MKRTVYSIVVIVFLSAIPGLSHAGSAEVLPKGIWAVNMDYTHYIPWTKKFDKNGDVVDAASDFNGVLGTNLFPDLALFETPPFNIASPNIGTSMVSFKYRYERVNTLVSYGITDKLSAGVKIPYIWYKNDVTTALDSTNANIGKNPAFNPAQPPSLANPPFIPVAIGGQTLTSEDVQDILGGGLFINGGLAIPGFGFKRIESWSQEGFGDIEAGLKYQYFSNKDWRLAFTGGVSIPTGKVDDPDNLVDQSFGSGSYAFLFRVNNDYIGIKNLILDATFNYSLSLPQHRTKRIITDPHQPIAVDKEEVRIVPSGAFELEASAQYNFESIQGFGANLLYNYKKMADSSVKGKNGHHIPALEAETGGMEQYYIVGVSYSTVPLFLKKKFPVPFVTYLSYRDKFAGNNSAFKTKYVNFGFTFYY